MNSDQCIVYLTPGFPDGENDVNCLPYVQDLLLLLKEKLNSDSMKVISFQYPFTNKKYKWHDLDVISIGGKNKGGIYKLITWIKVLTALRRLRIQYKITVVHAFWLNDVALVGRIFSAITGIPLIVTVIGQDPLKSNRYLQFLKSPKMKLVAISEFVSAKLSENIGRPANVVIPLVLRSDVFKEIEISERSYDIIGVGNLSALKNYTLFVDVIKIVVEIYPKLTAAIIGAGVEKETLNEKIKSLGLASNLFLPGNLLRSEVLSVMKNSKVLLHTSTYESQGFAMTEALYAGMKVVSTPVSDTRDSALIQTGSTAVELATAVVSILNNFKREQQIYFPQEKAVDLYLTQYRAD